MSAVQEVKKWKQYLLGNHFTFVTYQRSLIFLQGQRLLIGDQLRRATKLIGMI